MAPRSHPRQEQQCTISSRPSYQQTPSSNTTASLPLLGKTTSATASHDPSPRSPVPSSPAGPLHPPLPRKPKRASTTPNSKHGSKATSSTEHDRSPPVHPSLLQPRLAVVLNVPSPWHPWLFVSRLLSIMPAVWWGIPSALHVLLQLWPGQHVILLKGVGDADAVLGYYESFMGGGIEEMKARYALTEAGLATIWCFASGYLSFFFTDCLMSRWLINYTPQATIVRLLTVNAINAYATSISLAMTGGFEDPRLFLPGWVAIATALTVCYHITHQKINIRKETSTSMNVFSIASYISMVVLLVHMLTHQPNYPTMPIVSKAREIWAYAQVFVDRIQEKMDQAGANS